MKSPSEKTPAAEILFGGERILIRFLDANTPPRYMTVRALPLDLYPQLLKSLEHDSDLVGLYLDIETEDVRLIHPDTIAEALRIGDEINLRPFSESRARIDARLLRFAGEVNERRAEALSPKHGPGGAMSSPASAPARGCRGAPQQATPSGNLSALREPSTKGPLNRFLTRCWRLALRTARRL